MKELLLVVAGSAVGGGLRYLVSKAAAAMVASPFPLGTFAVNILGCLLIGIFSAMPDSHGWLTPSARLMLTTGFCGGFTTFSTFMKESNGLMTSHLPVTVIAYLTVSIAVGMVAVWVGYKIGGALQ